MILSGQIKSLMNNVGGGHRVEFGTYTNTVSEKASDYRVTNMSSTAPINKIITQEFQIILDEAPDFVIVFPYKLYYAYSKSVLSDEELVKINKVSETGLFWASQSFGQSELDYVKTPLPYPVTLNGNIMTFTYCDQYVFNPVNGYSPANNQYNVYSDLGDGTNCYLAFYPNK